MAQQPAKAEGAAEAAPKSKKKLIVILAVVLALAAGGGAAAFFLLKKPEAQQAKAKHGEKAEGHEDAAAEGEAAEEEAPEEEASGHADPKTALTYVQFETFTVNLLPDPDDKFLQLDLTVEVKGAELAEKMKAQMPVLRNRVLLLLTSKKASDISTPEGKAQLSEELLVELKKPLAAHGKPLKVTQVLFTSFVIQ
ncbi:flagellar basal body-associated FliL family protein [Methylophilus sp. 14]|uniref:flagellar basal body-associated FliL family protein n=1 Tax=Methylophilus sp. 14 TaxID=2781019 RepID=UPI0018909BDA|nr:flagellar basal body-associated FliL family protein [Methylophilus sp. 14]MBF4988710.1 flagellar basal body-associated FliL family protein [Methylophilus sp. 14]